MAYVDCEISPQGFLEQVLLPWRAIFNGRAYRAVLPKGEEIRFALLDTGLARLLTPCCGSHEWLRSDEILGPSSLQAAYYWHCFTCYGITPFGAEEEVGEARLCQAYGLDVTEVMEKLLEEWINQGTSFNPFEAQVLASEVTAKVLEVEAMAQS